ncbi:glyoxylase-like metal-dependent hydrolase (beta-lactamase superfamily II) [Motilibacter peucedani]|uniref:Glyoxylase-like metal-dependent hydrolase (Beta-lactamase superfamily II) n=1 Tax=Motilibacter peucedani TaxID=598650 RepID=A0A420XSE9_9ACTN|nr:MBL fold metallo-hydrolase [Motilibacter peucedani]RKS77741.1 glyoxylase-like metal-dependent hydrolase (beta-lactamase superfamily II) [Motilibacter peucedani]
MLVAGLPAAAFGTNCWVLAPAPGEQCLVVDPGVGVVPGLEDVLAEHRLRPAAVLLTHGHVDHTFSVRPVCGARGIPAYLDPADTYLLEDPFGSISAGTLEAFRAAGLEWSEPDDVRPLEDGGVLELAGLRLTVTSAPGHTPGSVLFSATSEAGEPLTLTGDVLFKGSIGRTDLAGGSGEQMSLTLRHRVLSLPDETLVLPGHGPTTSIGDERRTNPYLRELQEHPA